MDQCRYCYQWFNSIKTHLRFCKQKPGQAVCQTNSRPEDSRNQPCPYCKEVFTRVKSHLPYCKRNPEYGACNGSTRRKVSSGHQHQQGQQPCPYCNELFTRLNTHLHYCKQKPGNDERNGNKQKPAGGELEIGCQCSSCHRQFKCLKKHLPYCTLEHKPEREVLQVYCPPVNSSDSSDICQRAHLEDELKKRLRGSSVDRRQPREVIETIEKIKRAVLETLKDDFPSTRWEAINSGSYYELVKVSLTKITPESLSF